MWRISLGSSRRRNLRPILLTLTVWLVPAPLLANTLIVDGLTYEITVYQDQTFDENAAALRAAAWWGDSELARTFADAFAAQIGVADTSSAEDRVYFGYAESTVYFSRFDATVPTVPSAYTSETGAVGFGDADPEYVTPGVSFASTVRVAVPEINAGSLSQAVLILATLWLLLRRRKTLHRSHVG